MEQQDLPIIVTIVFLVVISTVVILDVQQFQIPEDRFNCHDNNGVRICEYRDENIEIIRMDGKQRTRTPTDWCGESIIFNGDGKLNKESTLTFTILNERGFADIRLCNWGEGTIELNIENESQIFDSVFGDYENPLVLRHKEVKYVITNGNFTVNGIKVEVK